MIKFQTTSGTNQIEKDLNWHIGVTKTSTITPACAGLQRYDVLHTICTKSFQI